MDDLHRGVVVPRAQVCVDEASPDREWPDQRQVAAASQCAFRVATLDYDRNHQLAPCLVLLLAEERGAEIPVRSSRPSVDRCATLRDQHNSRPAVLLARCLLVNFRPDRHFVQRCFRLLLRQIFRKDVADPLEPKQDMGRLCRWRRCDFRFYPVLDGLYFRQ